MAQALKHSDDVSNPVKDSLKENASNPAFMQISKLEQGKDLKVSSNFQFTPKYLLLCGYLPCSVLYFFLELM